MQSKPFNSLQKSKNKSLLLKQMAGSTYFNAYAFLADTFQSSISSYITSRIPYFDDHGAGHAERIIENFDRLLSHGLLTNLTPIESYVLATSSWFHDVGMLIDFVDGQRLTTDEMRDRHHITSSDFVIKNYLKFGIRNRLLAEIIAGICLCHRRSIKIEKHFLVTHETLLGDTIRPRLLAAIFRIADALDCGERRAPEINSRYVQELPATSRKFWHLHQLISGWHVEIPNVIISAHIDNADELAMVRGFITDTNEEISSVLPILAEDGISLVKAKAQIINHNSGELTEIDHFESKLTKSFVTPSTSAVDGEFMKIWGSKGSQKSKLDKSTSFYKKFHLHSQDIAPLICLKQEYLENYCPDVEPSSKWSFTYANWGTIPVNTIEFVLNGIIPIENNETLKLRCIDITNREILQHTFHNNELTNKLIEAKIAPLLPGQTRTIAIEHCWPAPSLDVSPRWFYALIRTYTYLLRFKLILPNDLFVKEKSVFIEEHPWARPLTGKYWRNTQEGVYFTKRFPERGSVYKIHFSFEEKRR